MAESIPQFQNFVGIPEPPEPRVPKIGLIKAKYLVHKIMAKKRFGWMKRKLQPNQVARRVTGNNEMNLNTAGAIIHQLRSDMRLHSDEARMLRVYYKSLDSEKKEKFEDYIKFYARSLGDIVGDIGEFTGDVILGGGHKEGGIIGKAKPAPVRTARKSVPKPARAKTTRAKKTK
jgi:hypothetical protein